MAESRRGLFRLLGAVAATPLAKALPEIPEAKAAAAPVVASADKGLPWIAEDCSASFVCDVCGADCCDYCIDCDTD